MKHLSVMICALFLCGSLYAGIINATVKTVSETAEFAAKKSGKALSPAMRKATEKAIEKAVVNYGDDVLKTVAHGGLETLEAGAKHGDDFWRLCHTAHPSAVRSLALHADDLMPIAKRLGPEFMTLEGKVPGLGRKAVHLFGDDAAKALAKAPADDISKLIGFAEKADSAKTASLLYKTYQKDGGRFLKYLDWKTIMASGLTASTIIAAYKISNGVEEGIIAAATKSPFTFMAISGLVALLLLLPLFKKLYQYLFGKKIDKNEAR